MNQAATMPPLVEKTQSMPQRQRADRGVVVIARIRSRASAGRIGVDRPLPRVVWTTVIELRDHVRQGQNRHAVLPNGDRTSLVLCPAVIGFDVNPAADRHSNAGLGLDPDA